MSVTLDQIRCLSEVKNTGSINSAALMLNKAKSAVSYSIKVLENQLGFDVLDHSKYRVCLTPKGDSFLIKALPLLEQAKSLESDISEIALGIEPRLTISISTIYPTEKLRTIMKTLTVDFPNTDFSFHREVLSGEHMLGKGEVDIAIFEDLRNTIDFDHKKIADIELLLVISTKHPFLNLQKEKQCLEELVKFPQIIQRSTIPSDFSMGIPKDSKKWTVSDISSKQALIIDNFGWGRLPYHLIKDDLKKGKLKHLEDLNLDHKAKLFICKNKERPFGPVLQHIWNSF